MENVNEIISLYLNEEFDFVICGQAISLFFSKFSIILLSLFSFESSETLHSFCIILRLYWGNYQNLRYLVKLSTIQSNKNQKEREKKNGVK